MQESKILKHHSLAKFLEQIEDHIGEGYSSLLNDIKTYPKQVAGMFFATMVKASPSEQEAELDTVVGVGVGQLTQDEMPKHDDVTAGITVGEQQEKPAPKRRTKTQGESQ
jgi:hypothetical protein